MIDDSRSSTTNGRNNDFNASHNEDTGFLLVEIVSALNVPNVDGNKRPDPFVTVEMAGRQVHQTDVLRKTQFPIWSLERGSLFLLDSRTCKYALFVLKDYETWRSDPTLGTLELSVDEMRNGTGKRREFPLLVPQQVVDLTKSVKATIVRKVRDGMCDHRVDALLAKYSSVSSPMAIYTVSIRLALYFDLSQPLQMI